MLGIGADGWIPTVISLALLTLLLRLGPPKRYKRTYVVFFVVYFVSLTLLALLIPEGEFFTIEKWELWAGLAILGTIGLRNPTFFSRILPLAVFLGLRPLVVSEFTDFHSLSLHILVGETLKFAVWCSALHLVLNHFSETFLEDVPSVFLPLSLSGLLVGFIEFLEWGLSAFHVPWSVGSAILFGGWVFSFWNFALKLEGSIGKRSYLLSAFLGAGLFYIVKPF